MSTFSIIITAGGIGKRMGSSLPKQFISIFGRPILMYTLEKFYHFNPKNELILTLPEEWRSFWEALIEEHDFKIPHRVVTGGKERYDSIKYALDFCFNDFIAVHDGVRPMVSEETIKSCFDAVQKLGAVIPVVPLKESLRKLNTENTEAVDRSSFVTVQTPQVFKAEILKKAYEIPYHDKITDDASLVEESGVEIHTVLGNEENIKITSQTDLYFTEVLLK